MFRIRPLFTALVPVAGVVGAIVIPVGCSKYTDDCAHTGKCPKKPSGGGASGASPITAGSGSGGQAGIAGDDGAEASAGAAGGQGVLAGQAGVDTDGEAGTGHGNAGGGQTAGAGGAGGAATAGAGGTPATGGSAGAPTESGAGGTAPCDSTLSPSEEVCVINEEFGVFVSPNGSDDNAGTRSAPYQTLSYALSAAHEAGKRVYACTPEDQSFGQDETLLIGSALAGAQVYGGFWCADWKYDSKKEKKAQIESKVPVAVRVEGIDGLLFEDLSIVAADADPAEPGSSSAALWVSDSKNVVLRGVALQAGKGADGADGADGYSSEDDKSAERGKDGNPGNNACREGVEVNPGGAQAVTEECPASYGGKGGDGGKNDEAGGNANGGEPNDHNPSTPEGNGGGGETNDDWTCARGGRGEDGADGVSQPPADRAARLGTFSADAPHAYIPSVGGTGADGLPGQGGGGGGGARAPDSCNGAAARTGASGGSGGGGGCGGKGGGGGQSGGGSFALVSYESIVKLDSVSLTTFAGGAGGKGGTAQAGGGSGAAGLGGTSTAKEGCDGGKGGKGGNGGNGGGGAGGPSIGIAYVGGHFEAQDLTFNPPESGASGSDGGGDPPDPNGKGPEGLLEPSWGEWPSEG